MTNSLPEYSKIKFNLPNNKTRIVWARKLREYKNGLMSYSVIDKHGDTKNEILIVTKTDIVWKKPARMSLKYAELEIKNVEV